jgi:hypothetical protein
VSDTNDIFTQVTAATSGPLDGDYLWSSGANWNLGVPIDGASVTLEANGFDDLAALTLANLTLNGSAEYGGFALVTGASLGVTSVTGAGSGLVADASGAGAPITVTVGTITTESQYYGAYGAGGVFVDQSAGRRWGRLLLANIYLHYVFDLWANRWRRQEATGDMIVVRYADDIVAGFEHEADACRFLDMMRARLEEFALTPHAEKTR